MLEPLELTLPGAPSTPVHALLPPGARRGMIVIHEILGRQPEIDRVVARFAAAGWACAAPALFASGNRLACIRRAVSAIASGQGEQLEQIRATRRWLSAQAGIAEERIGLIGFCLGGGFALAAGPGFGAVSTNYGEVPPSEVMRGIGPVIGCYAGRDRLFRGNAVKLKRRLGRVGVTPEVHTFDEAGHSFLTDGHHPIAEFFTRPLMHLGEGSELREQAWARISEFFDRAIQP